MQVQKEWQEHGMSFCSQLRQTFGCPLTLRPTPLATPVREQFYRTWQQLRSSAKLIATYHGTRQKNFSSIFETGLSTLGQPSSQMLLSGSGCRAPTKSRW